MHAYRSFLLLILIGFVGTASNATQLSAQEIQHLPLVLPMEQAVETGTLGEVESIDRAATSNPMLWQQYQALQMGGSAFQSCSTCNSNNKRCGCNPSLFPLIDGPGDCDQWCVGPKWDVDAGILMMFRSNANWDSVRDDNPGDPTLLEEQFGVGPGGRIFVTDYNDAGYGIQIGYEGINDWDAALSLDLTGGNVRNFLYQSRLNSVEINFLTNNLSPWKLFTGFRYVQLEEKFTNTTNVNKPIPAPANGTTAVPFTDTGANNLLINRLFGFQIGGRRDSWNIGNKLTFQTFANAGVYCNKFRRDDVDTTITTIITNDDLATTVNEFSRTTSTVKNTTRNNITDLAFVGEAGLTATWRLNQCVALRGGYQVLVLNGVGQALDASFATGLNGETALYHGLQFGLEYRR